MKVMILGAGIYQLPLIKKAKMMGHEVYVVSPSGDYPGIKEADCWIDSDTRDKDYILTQAKKYSVDGVVTTGTDVAVPTIGHLVDNMGLSGTGYEASITSMDKTLMKKSFVDHGVNTAEFILVSSVDELHDAAKELGLPVMVKAVDSSGSRGISKVTSFLDMNEAYKESLKVSNSKYVIVEKFLEGKEIGAQVVVGNNEVKHVFLHDDIVTPPPVSVPIGHSMPLQIDVKLQKEIRNQIELAIDAIGIKNTISNVDIMMVGSKPYLLEIGARMGATCLPENVTIYSGHDIYELLVLECLGKKTEIVVSSAGQPNAALLIISHRSGKIKRIHIPKVVNENRWLDSISIDKSVGDNVNEFKVGPDRIGQIIVRGRSSEHAIEIAKRIRDDIIIEVE
ncbi:ATP-grasp domain-containing protein [Vibrio splendidus]|uniref:ATP-grasp domain-containing protein n=1 Tax=Vibrio splendidus TaxID=29497 RepID=UPI00352E4A64